MARSKAFDVDTALDAAIAVFREHGYEGSSAQMLVDEMAIGRQSLYDTFGDKWQLYQHALRRYSLTEVQAHRTAMKSRARAIDGIRAMVERVVAGATMPCLGVGSVAEFGGSRPELAKINEAAGRVLRAAVIDQVRTAQQERDIARDLDPDIAATFFISSFAGIRIAARGGASRDHLEALGDLTLRALR